MVSKVIVKTSYPQPIVYRVNRHKRLQIITFNAVVKLEIPKKRFMILFSRTKLALKVIMNQIINHLPSTVLIHLILK